MSKIKHIHAREVLDSRGNPTIEAIVELSSGVCASAMVPSGASTGIHEAYELRDKTKRYNGKGVQKAIKNITNELARRLYGMKVEELQMIDQYMIEIDGTKQKSKLGANAILAVSLACARAGSAHQELPLYKYLAQLYSFSTMYDIPRPMMNVLNGGRHADNGLDMQEFMIVPKHKTVEEQIRIGVEIYHALHDLLHQKKLSTGLGDEGGFAPQLKKDEMAIELLLQAITKAGFTPGKQVEIALDPAASEFYSKKKYTVDKQKLSSGSLIDLYTGWVEKYPIISIEDPLAEDDWEGWIAITERLGSKIMVVGDDLFVTNTSRLEEGIAVGAGNAILIKLNQIGTVSETMTVIQKAFTHNYSVIVSHRSGETNDSFIADLAVAVGAQFIKLGAPARGERVAKLNRLLAISEELS